MKKDFYKVFGVAKNAKARDIRRAYQKMARRLHPDVNPGDPRAARQYRELREAYSVFTSRASRDRYDRTGESGETAAPAVSSRKGVGVVAESRGWEAILKDIFHDETDGETSSLDRSGEDIHQVLEIGFEDALKGAQKLLVYQREVICGACRGRRFAAEGVIDACKDCGGTGLLSIRKGPYTVKKICHGCFGTGEVSDDLCQECAGRGRSLVTERQPLTVPAGSDSGTKIIVAGRGQPGRGGRPGDLVVTLRVQPHPLLERRGCNLYCTIPLTVMEAALGTALLVPTAERKVSLKIPPGTQGGQQFRLKGKGVPQAGGDKRGDFYVTVTLVVPKATDPRARRLMRELEKLFPENPRVRD